MTKYKAISLFSGLGGDTLGLQDAGCDVIAYNEIDKHFCKSHEMNFPNSELIHHEDDRNIQNIPDEVFEKYKNDVDIMFAGFPCQGFSKAGKKLPDDPRNTLFREFVRFTKITKPKLIIGENVPGLLKRKTVNNENYIDVIVREFENLGYDVKYKVLKADQYGVPQERKRLFIIGVKKDDNPYNWEAKFPEPLNTTCDLKNIIKYNMDRTLRVEPSQVGWENIPDECIIKNMKDRKKYGDDNNAHPYLKSLYNADEEKRTRDGKTHDNLFSFGKRISPIHGEIIDIRKPTKTIICSYGRAPRFFVPIQNKNGTFLRVILPDELKQIQGFPSDYKVHGDWAKQVTQVGNAVPPPLIKQIVTNII